MKTRNAGIDLLRVILALMVIALHYNSSLGNVEVNTTDLSLNWYLVWIVESVSFCAVNVYVIITGYYSYIGNKDFPAIIYKLRNLWFTVLFYSVAGYIVITLFEGRYFSIVSFGKRLVPIVGGEWWFFSLYFIIIFFSPFINHALRTIDGVSQYKIWMIGIIVLCLVPQILLWNDGMGIDNGYSLIWFLFLYYTGALIAKYHQGTLSGSTEKTVTFIDRHKYSIYLLCIIILFGSKAAIAAISNRIWGEVKYSGLLFSYNSIFVYFSAITLFFIFHSLNNISGWLYKVISFLSPPSLASYLFHCQVDFREIIWTKMECYRFANSKYLPLAFIATVFILYLLAVLIEWLRSKSQHIIRNVMH